LQNPQGLTKHEPLQNLEGFQNEHNEKIGLYRQTLLIVYFMFITNNKKINGKKKKITKELTLKL